MIEFIKDYPIEMLSLSISLLALAVSSIFAVKGWMKNRTIYNVEYCEFLPEQHREAGNKNFRDKLSSGNYTILHADYRNGQYNVLLGKLKK